MIIRVGMIFQKHQSAFFISTGMVGSSYIDKTSNEFCSSSATASLDELNRLQSNYNVTVECSDATCLFNNNLSMVSIICPPSYSIRIHNQFYQLFFRLLPQQINLLVPTCQYYLPYSKVIDYSRKSTPADLAWFTQSTFKHSNIVFIH